MTFNTDILITLLSARLVDVPGGIQARPRALVGQDLVRPARISERSGEIRFSASLEVLPEPGMGDWSVKAAMPGSVELPS